MKPVGSSWDDATVDARLARLGVRPPEQRVGVNRWATLGERAATAILTSRAEHRMQRYVREERYWPLVGLSDWVRSRSDERSADAIRPHDDDPFENRIVDIREPALLEPRSGYVFVRQGLYRPSFQWWEYARLASYQAFGQYATWLLHRNQFTYFPEAVSLRSQAEKNYWHCHDEVLSKLRLVDGLGLPRDIPLLVGPSLWNRPFFGEMRSARGLRDRNWVLHDQPVWSSRLLLCIQGPTHPANPQFVRDLFRDPDPGAGERVENARRLFVIRPPDRARHFDNERDLADALAGLGFESIMPDRLPFSEQVRSFGAAECVVLAHGAGLANVIHRVGSPLGLIEVFPDDPEMLRRAMGPWLSRESGFVYRGIVGTPMSPSGGFTVNTDAVVSAAKQVLHELVGEQPAGCHLQQTPTPPSGINSHAP